MSKQRKYLHLQEALIYWRITDLRLLFVSKFMISFKNQINKLTTFCFSKLYYFIALFHISKYSIFFFSFLISMGRGEMSVKRKGEESNRKFMPQTKKLPSRGSPEPSSTSTCILMASLWTDSLIVGCLTKIWFC